MAVGLGALAALTWGLSTFLAFHLGRGISAVTLTFWTQLLGLLPLVPLALLLDGPRIEFAEFRTGLIAGAGVGVSLVLLYMGLRHVTVGVTSAVAGSTGTIGPVVFAIAYGVRPSVITLAGIVVSVVAIVVLTLARHRGDGQKGRLAPAAVLEIGAMVQVDGTQNEGGNHVLGMVQACLSGLAMSIYYIALSGLHGRLTFWVLAASRIGAALVVSLMCIKPRRSLGLVGQQYFPLAAIGATAVLGAVFYILALRQGGQMIVIVPVISLSPAVAVFLAWVISKERLSRTQLSALLVAAVAIVAVVSG